MASNFKIGTSARNAACDAIVDLIDVGGAGTCKVFTGSPPTNVSDSDPAGILGTLTFSATAFGAASTGVATAAAITSATAGANGDAGCFRVKSGGGTTIFQGTAGEASDAPVDMLFNEKTIVSGGTIAITSFTVTVPIQ